MLRRGGARSERERYCQSALTSVEKVESIAATDNSCTIAVGDRGWFALLKGLLRIHNRSVSTWSEMYYDIPEGHNIQCIQYQSFVKCTQSCVICREARESTQRGVRSTIAVICAFLGVFMILPCRHTTTTALKFPSRCCHRLRSTMVDLYSGFRGLPPPGKGCNGFQSPSRHPWLGSRIVRHPTKMPTLQ